MRTGNDIAIAGGAVALALIDHLVKSGKLTTDDAKAILTAAQARVRIFPTENEAALVVGEIYGGLRKASN